jgi:hypothetical protein
MTSLSRRSYDGAFADLGVSDSEDQLFHSHSQRNIFRLQHQYGQAILDGVTANSEYSNADAPPHFHYLTTLPAKYLPTAGRHQEMRYSLLAVGVQTELLVAMLTTSRHIASTWERFPPYETYYVVEHGPKPHSSLPHLLHLL